MPTPTAKYAIKAEDKSSSVIRGIKGKLKGLSGAFGGMGASIAGIVGVGGFGAMIKGSLDSADAMQKLSIQLGFSTEFLSEMKHAAELSGASLDDVTKGGRKLQQSLTDAADGGKSTSEAFDKLGLSVDELLQLHPDEQLLIVGDALSKMENQAEKTDTAMLLMGKSGAALNQVFVGGADSVQKMRNEAEALGLSLSRDAADGAANANDAILRLEGAFKGAGQSLATDFAGPIENIADFIRTTLVPILGFLLDSVTTVGRAFGGMAAGVVALLSGNFSEAGSIFSSTFDDAATAFSDSFAKRTAENNRPLNSPTQQKADREQKETREVIKEQTSVLKQVAKNTANTKFAVAG